ncbi:MAG TPA: DUF4198 domain-containing protein [Gemmataceae bacterium]|jgi:uncharacterized GH25 family protein
MTKYFLGILAALMLTAALSAHDTWVQTNTNIVRAGDNIHIDLMLGNHGNDHRDFKLAGKIDLEGCTLTIVAPDGKRYDLKDRLSDTGYTPKEGYWTTPFAAVKPGLYLVAHTSDKVVSYAPTRSVKSAKTYFVVSKGLDNVSRDNPGFDKPLGHALELVPQASPVTPMGPGTPIKVKLLYKGKPLAGARVSFIPRGVTLTEGFDARYERKTDERGLASFTPTEGNYYLVVAHHLEPKESGKKHQSTKYSATLTVLVPQVCPCCGE